MSTTFFFQKTREGRGKESDFLREGRDVTDHHPFLTSLVRTLMTSSTTWPNIEFGWRSLWLRHGPEKVPVVRDIGLTVSLNKSRGPVKSVGHHNPEFKEGDPTFQGETGSRQYLRGRYLWSFQDGSQLETLSRYDSRSHFRVWVMRERGSSCVYERVTNWRILTPFPPYQLHFDRKDGKGYWERNNNTTLVYDTGEQTETQVYFHERKRIYQQIKLQGHPSVADLLK